MNNKKIKKHHTPNAPVRKYHGAKPDFKRIKYRISIVEGMKAEKIKKYGFELSYIIFERSINKMAKEGDLAEKKAVEYLKDKHLLSSNYQVNKVIALNRIKIEADIIDYDNKIVYEVKSRRSYELAKQAIRDKWMVFEYDKHKSIYADFKFKGIIAVNENNNSYIKRVFEFNNSTVNVEKMDRKFQKHFNLISEFRKIPTPEKFQKKNKQKVTSNTKWRNNEK